MSSSLITSDVTRESPSPQRLFAGEKVAKPDEGAVLAQPANSKISVRDFDFLDRKSTRLNSSHLVISYAVFCLKKKKTAYSTILAANKPISFQHGHMEAVSGELPEPQAHHTAIDMTQHRR